MFDNQRTPNSLLPEI